MVVGRYCWCSVLCSVIEEVWEGKVWIEEREREEGQGGKGKVKKDLKLLKYRVLIVNYKKIRFFNVLLIL